MKTVSMDQHGPDTPASRSGHPPLSENVYVALKNRITRGDYGENEKLPAEKDLSRPFGVLRSVLRVALEQLRNDGLVVSRQGAGNFVRVKRETARGYTPVETIADIQRCFEFRLTVEVDGAVLAARAAIRRRWTR